MKENNRRLSTTLSLQNLCMQRILDNKETSADLLKTLIGMITLTTINHDHLTYNFLFQQIYFDFNAQQSQIPYAIFCVIETTSRETKNYTAISTVSAPPLRTALMEKLTGRGVLQPEDSLLSTYRLLAMLVHRKTTFLRLPGCSRKRRLSTRGSTELENLTEEIAMGAPAAARLRFGKNLPYPLRSELLASDRFMQHMRHLQCLEAFSLTCNSTHLELIADNLPNLRYVCIFVTNRK
jgi:hypothetical protein